MDLELYFDQFQGVKFTKIVLGATYLNHQICFRALSNINVLHTFFIFLTDKQHLDLEVLLTGLKNQL